MYTYFEVYGYRRLETKRFPLQFYNWVRRTMTKALNNIHRFVVIFLSFVCLFC